MNCKYKDDKDAYDKKKIQIIGPANVFHPFTSNLHFYLIYQYSDLTYLLIAISKYPFLFILWTN
jgi:hypothetical protein